MSLFDPYDENPYRYNYGDNAYYPPSAYRRRTYSYSPKIKKYSYDPYNYRSKVCKTNKNIKIWNSIINI